METTGNVAVSVASREIARIQDAKNRLPLMKKRLAACQLSPDAASASLKVVDALRDAYESIAPPESRFGRISIVLRSDEEVDLCESIDELFDELDALATKDQIWPLTALMLFDRIEQLAGFQESQFRTAIAGYERDVRPGIYQVRSSLSRRLVTA